MTWGVCRGLPAAKSPPAVLWLVIGCRMCSLFLSKHEPSHGWLLIVPRDLCFSW